MPQKSPSEWSPAYRQRIERFLEKNPYATLDEARGHKKPPPVIPQGDYPAQAKHRLDTIVKNLNLREKLGKLSPADADKSRKAIAEIKSSVKKLDEKLIPGTKDYYLEKKRANDRYHQLRDKGLINPAEGKEKIEQFLIVSPKNER